MNRVNHLSSSFRRSMSNKPYFRRPTQRSHYEAMFIANMVYTYECVYEQIYIDKEVRQKYIYMYPRPFPRILMSCEQRSLLSYQRSRQTFSFFRSSFELSPSPHLSLSLYLDSLLCTQIKPGFTCGILSNRQQHAQFSFFRIT